MRHFFFDLREGARMHTDRDGTDCDSFGTAVDAARRFLGELARDHVPDEGYHTDVMIRDAATGEIVFTATLTMASARLGASPLSTRRS
ncbi:DUF6894 family protein [Methylobacterium nigriterrae]|uniref:DUF6894 family protein n=1 Tax=Methylobacterium nigriterrae TaxID=3127512 RepID=UPI003D672C94